MKPLSSFALSALIIGATTGGACAAQPHVYANTISAHNISVMQHSIMLNAMQTYQGSAAAALGNRAKITDIVPVSARESKNTPDLYGRMPIYGTMPLYGEYGDDGAATSITRGRNGGDEYGRPVLNSMWLNWAHYGDDAKFRHYDRLDSDYDVVMIGIAGGDAQWGIGISQWGLFGGYVGGTQENDFLNIDEDGGYWGLYSGYGIGNFNLSVIANGGALYNRAETEFGTDEYANMWAGAAARATYNIALDDTFTLQPGVYAGYTWIKSANYTSQSGENIANKNFNMFEITPALRAIKHIGKGWFGFIGAQYIFEFANGGDTTVNGTKLSTLETENYAEYGIGIEKSIDRFNLTLQLSRRDGGRTGWAGGLNLKYIF